MDIIPASLPLFDYQIDKIATKVGASNPAPVFGVLLVLFQALNQGHI